MLCRKTNLQTLALSVILSTVPFIILSDDRRQIDIQVEDEDGEFIEPGSCEWYDLVWEQV